MGVRFWRRPDAVIDSLIKKPVQKYAGHDESLGEKAAKRRKVSESIKQRAALVASGSSSGSVLQLARKAK